jgi:hypothetical protein
MFPMKKRPGRATTGNDCDPDFDFDFDTDNPSFIRDHPRNPRFFSPVCRVFIRLSANAWGRRVISLRNSYPQSCRAGWIGFSPWLASGTGVFTPQRFLFTRTKSRQRSRPFREAAPSIRSSAPGRSSRFPPATPPIISKSLLDERAIMNPFHPRD